MGSLKKNKLFISFLLTSDVQQMKVLLGILSLQQIQVILELFLNVLHGNFRLGKATHNIFKRYKKMLRHLLTDKLSLRRKGKIIAKHAKVIAYLLLRIKSQILAKLKDGRKNGTADMG